MEPSKVDTNGTNGTGATGATAHDAPVLAALDRLERRLARIEDAVARVTTVADTAAPAVATAVDAFDSAVRRAQDEGADVDARVRAGLALLDRLTAPETLRVLEQAVRVAEQAPALVAVVTDTLDGLARRAGDAGIDLDARAKNLVSALEKLTSPAALSVLQDLLDRVDVVRGLLESGVFDPAPVAVVSRAGEALAMTGREPAPAVGAWGALRALSDADVQHAVGFALRFAQRFGRALREPLPAAALPSGGSTS